MIASESVHIVKLQLVVRFIVVLTNSQTLLDWLGREGENHGKDFHLRVDKLPGRQVLEEVTVLVELL